MTSKYSLTIINQHTLYVTKLKTFCNNAEHLLVISDVWTDRQLRSYIGITLHTFIDDDLKLYLLSFRPVIAHHKAKVSLTEFEKVINYYRIDKKFVRLITDNAANI
jgi:hypothetical protein